MKTVSKKNKPAGVYKSAGVYNTTTSLPQTISGGYILKNMSLSFDQAFGPDYYSSWTWAIPGFHDRKILKKKQRRDIDNIIKRYGSEKRYTEYDYNYDNDTISWLDNNGFSFKSSSGPLSPPTGIISYMDFLGPSNGGNNP